MSLLSDLKKLRNDIDPNWQPNTLETSFRLHNELKGLSTLERLKRIQKQLLDAKALEDEYLI